MKKIVKYVAVPRIHRKLSRLQTNNPAPQAPWESTESLSPNLIPHGEAHFGNNRLCSRTFLFTSARTNIYLFKCTRSELFNKKFPLAISRDCYVTFGESFSIIPRGTARRSIREGLVNQPTNLHTKQYSRVVHCKKKSGNLRDQILSYFYLMISTFKLLTNRSFSFQLF